MKSLLFLLPLVAAAPSFYLQIANGTHAGQYLTASTYVPKNDPPKNYANVPVTWVNNLNNASIWSYYTYSNGGTGLSLVDQQEVTIAYNGNDPSPTEILIGDGHDPTTCCSTEWGVQIVLDGWSSGAPTGAAHERDDTLTQYRAFTIINGHVGISGLGQKGAEYIALKYLRIST